MVMEKTTIQLPVMNTATIASWYNKLQKKQEKSMLEQGLSIPKNTNVSPESLPLAVVRKDRPCVPTSSVANPHIFVLPSNTAGTAQLKQRRNLPVTPSAIRPPFLAALDQPLHPPQPVPQPLLLAPQPLLPAPQPLLLAPQPLLLAPQAVLRKLVLPSHSHYNSG
uniref:probable helicase with zinc finger domain n=1 Tax=Solea senegalensis TaxID=28829 RepID=UPI001CD87942|nr:probable helicase with zinc finger domain [Solea senegalensis]